MFHDHRAHYSARKVALIMGTGMLLGAIVNSTGLRNWAQRLPVSDSRDFFLSVTTAFDEAVSVTGVNKLAQIGSEKFAVAMRKPFNWATPRQQYLAELRKPAPKVKLAETTKPKAVKPQAAPQKPIKPQRVITKTIQKPTPPVQLAALAPPQNTATIEAPTLENYGTNLPRVLIMGDSMMVGSLGRVLESELRARNVEHERHAKIATGLARPDYFNWHAKVRQVYSNDSFDLAVVMLGGNDTQNIEVDGQRYDFGTKGWNKIYTGRVHRLLNYMCVKTSDLIWLGSPAMRSPRYNRKIMLVNHLVENVVKQHECARYVPTAPWLASDKGGYTSFLRYGGRSARVRMSDGIHLTRTGGHVVTDHLLPQLGL